MKKQNWMVYHNMPFNYHLSLLTGLDDQVFFRMSRIKSTLAWYVEGYEWVEDELRKEWPTDDDY